MDEKREYEDRMNPGVQPEYVVQKLLRLTDLLFALRKRAALIIICAAVGLVVGIALSIASVW